MSIELPLKFSSEDIEELIRQKVLDEITKLLEIKREWIERLGSATFLINLPEGAKLKQINYDRTLIDWKYKNIEIELYDLKLVIEVGFNENIIHIKRQNWERLKDQLYRIELRYLEEKIKELVQQTKSGTKHQKAIELLLEAISYLYDDLPAHAINKAQAGCNTAHDIIVDRLIEEYNQRYFK